MFPGEGAGPLEHGSRAVNRVDPPRPAGGFDGETAVAAAEIRHVERGQEVAEGARPGGPAAAGHELAGVGAVGVEVLAALAQHLLEPRVVGPCGGGRAGLVELRLQVRPEAREAAVDGGGVEAVVGEPAGGLLGDQACVFEEPEVPRDAGLRQAEHGGELRDVEALPGEHPEQPEPDGFSEQAVERGGLNHIYKSI